MGVKEVAVYKAASLANYSRNTMGNYNRVLEGLG